MIYICWRCDLCNKSRLPSRSFADVSSAKIMQNVRHALRSLHPGFWWKHWMSTVNLWSSSLLYLVVRLISGASIYSRLLQLCWCCFLVVFASHWLVSTLNYSTGARPTQRFVLDLLRLTDCCTLMWGAWRNSVRIFRELVWRAVHLARFSSRTTTAKFLTSKILNYARLSRGFCFGFRVDDNRSSECQRRPSEVLHLVATSLFMRF